MKRWGILGLSLLLLASSIAVFATEGYGLRIKSDVINQAGEYPLMEMCIRDRHLHTGHSHCIFLHLYE